MWRSLAGTARAKIVTSAPNHLGNRDNASRARLLRAEAESGGDIRSKQRRDDWCNGNDSCAGDKSLAVYDHAIRSFASLRQRCQKAVGAAPVPAGICRQWFMLSVGILPPWIGLPWNPTQREEPRIGRHGAPSLGYERP